MPCGSNVMKMDTNVTEINKSGSFGTVNVSKCARCGLDHGGLDMMKFTNPPEFATHYSVCPETGEPILMKIAKT